MRPHRFAGAVLLGVLAAAPLPALGTPLDFIPVGDPIEDELRLLDITGPSAELPHLDMRPLQVFEIPDLAEGGNPAARIAIRRLRRQLARDRAGADTTRAATRLIQLAYPGDQRFETSVALEGGGIVARDRSPSYLSPTGLHTRFGVQNGRWVLHTDMIAGHVTRGRRFAQALLPGHDAILHSEEAYLGYAGEADHWALQIGRTRWHWGPGEEGSLLLSKTAAPLTGMTLRFRIPGLRADGIALSATPDATAGEQLAAHRLEWQPLDRLRVGLSEAARYKSNRWEPLYWVGVLPYTLVQNLMVQDEPDSGRAVHNNVMASLDAAYGFVPGQRIYGELLIDDLRTDHTANVSTYGYQVGWEGVLSTSPFFFMEGGRLSWSLEYTRLTRFVYTSSYGRRFVAEGLPLGFPTGPDSRRLRLGAAWDPSTDWQFFTEVSRTDQGESGLDHAFVPGTGVNANQFLGVVEIRKDADVGVRYWPVAGLDVSVRGGYSWVDQAAHVPGARLRQPRAELRFRLVR